jgi:Spy/CpxP family protein refolding chaperone
MWKPALTVSAILSLGFMAVTPQAIAPMVREKSPSNLKDYLALTGAQQKALEELQAAMRVKARASVAELEEKQKALRTRLASGDLDPFAVGKLVIEMEVAKNKAEATSEELRSMAMRHLTDAQKARLQALEEARALQPVVREAIGMFLLAPPAAVTNGAGPLGMFPAQRRKPPQPQSTT